MFNGESLQVARGTYWNQTKCSLDFSATDRCYTTTLNDRDYLGPSELRRFNQDLDGLNKCNIIDIKIR